MINDETIFKELCKLSNYMERNINKINDELLLLTPLLLKIVECITQNPLHSTEADQCALLLKNERLLNTYVSELNLSVRANNALKYDGIKTIRQLSLLSWHELLRIPNFGYKSGRDIREALGKVGLYLRDDEAYFLKYHNNQ